MTVVRMQSVTKVLSCRVTIINHMFVLKSLFLEPYIICLKYEFTSFAREIC